MSEAKIKKKRYVKPQSVKDLEQFAFKKIRKIYPNVPAHAILKPKYTERTSNGLTRCVVDLINLCGFQAERINSTGRPIDTRKESSLGIIGDVKWIKSSSKTGTADISATIKGRAVKIEIKCKATGDRYQSEGQKTYQKEVERAGGIYLIVREFDDFFFWLKSFLTNE